MYKNLIAIIAVFFISLGVISCTPINKDDVSTKLRPDSQEEQEVHMDSQIVKYADLNEDKVDEKIIQFAPIRIGNQLLERIARHCSAPHHRVFLFHKKADG